tara:strand:- start:14655 stop:16286 length:1632 start_codon:yes stop_codon:yes gene_type:complete
MPTDAQSYTKRYEELRDDRRNWEHHWQEIAEVVLPRRTDIVGKRTPGDKRNLKAIDSTGIIANELLAAGLHGMMTNPASKWFTLRLSNANLNMEDEVKLWLEAVENIIYEELSSSESSFSSHMHELYLDLSAFGTAIMFIGETTQTQDLMFQSLPLKECYVSENADGRIDTLYRKYEQTVRQIVQKWGPKESAVGKDVITCYNTGKLEEKFEIIHAIFPRMDYDRRKRTRQNMPIASVYVLCKEDIILEESGYEEMPVLAPRWSKAAGEVYGRGPGMATLPDVKMLQQMAKTVIKAAQKVVDPPLQLEDDSVILPVRTIPGGLNYRRAGSEPITPLSTGAQIPIGLDMMQDVRTRIREGFFLDQLQLQQGPQMTATEVLQRTEEKLRLLGPVMGRMQSELLSPLINRVFGILGRQDKLPPLPALLEDGNYTIEFVSPLARAQRQVEANSLLRVFEIGSTVMQMQPDAGRVFKAEDTVRWLSGLFGIPQIILETETETQQRKQAEAQMQQQMQQMAMLQQGAEIANKAAPAIDVLQNAAPTTEA